MAFTVLLGFLVALPSFGIDMSLPALTATGAALGVAPAQAGLMMSLFMLGFAVAPLFYGPASDRYGRKPVVVFACTLFIIAGIGCAFARSLSTLLIWRVVQGAGAGASMTIALAIIRDLFEGQAARTRLSYVAIATMIVPMIAPTAGAALLALGGWRVIHAVLAGVGLVLLLAMVIGFAESARIDPANRLVPSVIARNYLRVLTHPLCLGVHPCQRRGFWGAVRLCQRLLAVLDQRRGAETRPIWPGVRGDLAGDHGGCVAQRPAQRLGRRAGLSADDRLGARGGRRNVATDHDAGRLDAARSVISLLVLANFAFGLIAPNAMQGAMQPLPQIAGAAGAATGCIQMATGAVVSGLVATLYDEHSALSMTALMAMCSLLALVSYLLLARPAERVVVLS